MTVKNTSDAVTNLFKTLASDQRLDSCVTVPWLGPGSEQSPSLGITPVGQLFFKMTETLRLALDGDCVFASCESLCQKSLNIALSNRKQSSEESDCVILSQPFPRLNVFL